MIVNILAIGNMFRNYLKSDMRERNVLYCDGSFVRCSAVITFF